ncbi:hypothetical protein CLV71_108136 [Actinophytocola oryzae]|uniref:Uncharacterized protein n=1 Tax=Actinophytocola oryzae TaxID=502181 RepID=A0A4R7VHF9_9PSEU|nr:hypothetical protein CLV71_108136 [Actinophytocola oryzae]
MTDFLDHLVMRTLGLSQPLRHHAPAGGEVEWPGGGIPRPQGTGGAPTVDPSASPRPEPATDPLAVGGPRTEPALHPDPVPHRRSATHDSSATHAGSADHPDPATHASSTPDTRPATHDGATTRARPAAHGSPATHPGPATDTGFADQPRSATRAVPATRSGAANHAGSAHHARPATHAGSANHVKAANQAGSANQANHAGSATRVEPATHNGSATHDGAGHTGSAIHAQPERVASLSGSPRSSSPEPPAPTAVEAGRVGSARDGVLGGSGPGREAVPNVTVTIGTVVVRPAATAASPAPPRTRRAPTRSMSLGDYLSTREGR